jgi:hypothetical protein
MKSAIVLFFLLMSSAMAESNDVMKSCLEANGYSAENFDKYDFSKAAGCHSDYRISRNKAKLDELRDFLKHNPRYRVPGQSLNRCWGKPREMPFESSYIKKTEKGFEAGVNYKDKLPAGCYENAPWDNRDEK